MIDTDGWVELKIPDFLSKENIVRTFAADKRCIHLELNHVYEDTTILTDIDKKSWQKTIKNFREAVAKKRVEQKHIDMLEDTLAGNYQIIDEISQDTIEGNKVHKQSNQEKGGLKKVYTAYKYSKNREGVLHEAVIVSGIPCFITYDKQNDKLVVVERIEEPSRILTPPYLEEHAHLPYEFANVDELQDYLNRAKKTDVYSLYERCKSQVKRYNDQDKEKQVLITTNIAWSYYQDKFPTTHYVGIVGDNGSGKSSIGETIEILAYRAVNMTNPNATHVFRVLGPIEAGQCTLVLDEADKIEDPDMQAILKTGYRNGKRVPRVNTNTWKLEYYQTYCSKFFLAENSPNQWKSKGVLDRTFTDTAYKGNPSCLIEETLEPQGNPERLRLHDELIDLRKLMLIHRILHFEDPVTEIDVGVEGRNMQLSKPYIQLFYGTPAQKEVEETLQHYLDIKNEKKSNSKEAILITIIRKLLYEEGRKDEPILTVGRIWEQIKVDLGGEGSSFDPNECYTDYGVLHRNTITKIFEDKYGAKAIKHKGKRALRFDLEKLARVEKTYGTQTKICTTLKREENENRESSRYSPKDGKDSYDGTTGTPPHNNGEGHESNKENNSASHADIEQINMDNENNSEDWGELQSNFSKKQDSVIPEPSQLSQPSPEQQLYEKFWSTFQELVDKEQQSPSNHLTVDKNTVSGSELTSRLYDSGLFSRSEIRWCMTEAIQSGALKKVSYDTYRART